MTTELTVENLCLAQSLLLCFFFGANQWRRRVLSLLQMAIEQDGVLKVYVAVPRVEVVVWEDGASSSSTTAHLSWGVEASYTGRSVLQFVAVCCSVLQCAAVCCSVLQCDAVCCSVLQGVEASYTGRSVLQFVAVCCSVLQCVAVCCSVMQCVAVCCSVLQCVAVCCSVLQCVAV